MSSRGRLLLWLVILLGVAARPFAIGWNDRPHGDIHLDLATVRALADGEGLRTPVERSVALYPPVDDRAGVPLDQHPPLLALMAAPLAGPVGDPYLALRLVSLLFGLLAIGAAAWSAARVIGREAALPAAALIAASYALIDFSGNGSIYAVQTALVLAIPGALTIRFGAFAAGALCALAWLTNYQSAVYAVAVVLAILIARGKRGFSGAALVTAGFAVVAAPWWIRNAQVFGDPFFSVNPLYLTYRLGGVPSLVEDGAVPRLVLEGPPFGALIKALVSNLIVNVRFVAVQTPLWLGPLLFAAAFGAVETWGKGRREGAPARIALLLLPAFHLMTMLAWPACKFRYVVPLVALAVLPALAAAGTRPGVWGRRLGAGLIAGLVLVALERLARGGGGWLEPSGARDGLALVSALVLGAFAARGGAGRLIGVFLLMQVGLGFAAGETRSTYYDGIVAADPFGRHDAERLDREREAALAAFGASIDLPAGTPVVANIALGSYAPAIRVIQPSPIQDPDSLARIHRSIVERFGAAWKVMEADDGSFSLVPMSP